MGSSGASNWGNFELTNRMFLPRSALDTGQVDGSVQAINAANVVKYTAFYVEQPLRLAWMITRFGATASGSFFVGIYDSDGTQGAPGTRLVKGGAGTAVASSTGTTLFDQATRLNPGKFYAALILDTATTQIGRVLNANAAVKARASYSEQPGSFALPATANATLDTSGGTLWEVRPVAAFT